MFFGSVKHQLDAKKRIRIPSQFKEELGKGYVLTKGPLPGIIYVYPLATYIENTKKIFECLNPFSAKDNLIKQKYMAGKFSGEEDNQGRLLLKEDVREYASIKKDVITVGMCDHLEIFATEVYESQQLGDDFANVMQDIAMLYDQNKLQQKLSDKEN